MAGDLQLTLLLASSPAELTARTLLAVADQHEAGAAILCRHRDQMLNIAHGLRSGTPLTVPQQDYVRDVLCHRLHAPHVAAIVARLRAGASKSPAGAATGPVAPPSAPLSASARTGAQMAFQFEPPARRGAAPTRPEADGIYQAVLRLRRSGYRVYRCGALHRVGETLLSSAQLLLLGREMAGTR